MAYHRELYKDLPPAEELLKGYSGFLSAVKDADGYYIIVQYIAEKYGDKAYELAEEVFCEMGMKYDRDEMRRTDGTRRVGYAFDGPNVYNIDVRKFEKGMEKDLLRVYNAQARLLSEHILMDEDYLHRYIINPFGTSSGGLFLAYNEANHLMGFIHCCLLGEGEGSVEALFFYNGRIFEAAARKLIAISESYFKENNITRVRQLNGHIRYPFYEMPGKAIHAAFENKLPHIFKYLASQL
jgi:hypothetical protein